MSTEKSNSFILPSIILGFFLFAGLSYAGYCISKGALRFKSDIRSVTVKGLVEKEVKADQAIWTLTFKRAGNQLHEANAQINKDREIVKAFLQKQGFQEAEIRQRPVSILDKYTRQYSQVQESDPVRYIVTSTFVVTTSNIDRVEKSLGATEELLNAGVILDTQSEGGETANPRYIITGFNTLRPELLAEATKNARTIAQQFADDSGARVGSIRSANQGVIQIFGSTGNDESAYYSPTSTPVKKIRVVSTLEFELK